MIRVRAATADDLGLIAAFIRKLADYERLAHEVRFDEAELARHLFGERPAAEVLIAEWCGAPAGFALFYQTFSTFEGAPGIWLEDLFVDPEFRGRRIGTALLARLAHLTIDRDGTRLEWAVLDWNESGKRFYRGIGASHVAAWERWRLSDSNLFRLSHEVDRVIEASQLDYVRAAMAPVGTVTDEWRNGHLLRCDGVAFALIEDGVWLASDAESDPQWDAARCDPYHLRFSDGTELTRRFRAAPPEALVDPEAFRRWAALALAAGRRSHAAG